MEFHFLSMLTILSMAMAVVGNAALPPEIYWKKVFPNTPMPKAIRDSLQPEWMEEKSTAVSVGKGGVNVNTGKPKTGGTNVNVGHGSVGVHTNKPGHGTSVGVGKGGVTVGTGPKGKPVHVTVKPGPSPFIYRYAATETQLHDSPTVALFFLRKSLSPSTKMNLHFTKSTNDAAFLPRRVANSVPFSSDDLPAILDRFSVDPNSEEARVMKETIKQCEEKGIQGEEKYCATSLESMVDYATSKLGKGMKVISTEAEKETGMQTYTITGVKKVLSGGEGVVCHKQNYPYAVFYCHATKTTEAYTVAMVGDDGTKVQAAAVCHTDTSAWNPKHLAFQVLKVKPGSVPVCHFLPEDHLVWARN
ncbi:hypothetical protein Ancab_002226 [Ancistrocladus abbreviatus]